jgi:hypothetical protein
VYFHSGGVVVSSHGSGAPELYCGQLLPSPILNKLLLGLTLGLLLFGLACGSSGSSIPITGTFSNASLNGQYAYRLAGFDTIDGEFSEAGVFTADGAGHVTTGTDDFNTAVGFSSTPITGNYSIGHDGNGSITLNIGGGQINLTITMLSTSKFYLAEADAFVNFSANAVGEGAKQTASAFTSPPTGTFVFRVHQTFPPPAVSEGTVGTITSTNAAVTGSFDVVRSNTFSSLTFTGGNFSVPDSTGRGTLTYTDSQAIPTNFRYYVIDANTLWFMETDANTLGVGTAERQASGTLTLSGNYAFGSSGDTNANIGGVRTVGGFTAGGGTISAGAYDSVRDGSSTVNQPFTGTYTATAKGRVDVTLVQTGGTGAMIPLVFWMVSPSRAYLLFTDVSKVEEGTVDLQQVNTFANSDLKGQYALVMDGSIPGLLLTRVGTFIPDGNGNLNLNEEANSINTSGTPLGSISDVVLPGTYSVAGSGRATSTITGSSSNVDLVMYMVSSNQAYILQSDPGVEVSGQLTLQSSP